MEVSSEITRNFRSSDIVGRGGNIQQICVLCTIKFFGKLTNMGTKID